MGVRGLWKLLEPAAEEVDLESLRGKTIAVDASIWMHQFSKAVRDQEGAPIQGAALLGFCRRICKLLYYGVKPVFVFDGSGPRIKKLTLGVRMRRREAARKNEMEANMKLTSKRLRHHIISKLQNLDENKKAKIADTGEVFFRKSSKKHDIDYYDLPAERSTLQSHIQEVAEDPRLITRREVEQGITEYLNLNDVSMELDLDSEHFKSLPIQTQYDLITEIKEKSRESSKKRSQKMISLSADPMAFSNLQIKYLLRRNEIAERLSILNRMPVDDGSPSDKQLPMLKGLRVAGRRNREYFLFKDKPQHTRKSSPDAESRSDSPQTPGYACQEEGFTISRYQYSHELEQDFNYSSSYVPPKTPPPASARNDAFLDYLEQQPSEDDGVSPDSYTDLTPKSSHSELSSYSHNSCGSSEKHYFQSASLNSNSPVGEKETLDLTGEKETLNSGYSDFEEIQEFSEANDTLSENLSKLPGVQKVIFSDDSSGGDANGAQLLVTRNWSPEYLESAIMDLVQRNLGDEDNFEKERIHHVIKSAINIWDFGEFLRNIRDVDRVVFAGISDIDVKSRILFTQILSCILRWKISNTKPGVQCSDTERNVDNPMESTLRSEEGGDTYETEMIEGVLAECPQKRTLDQEHSDYIHEVDNFSLDMRPNSPAPCDTSLEVDSHSKAKLHSGSDEYLRQVQSAGYESLGNEGGQAIVDNVTGDLHQSTQNTQTVNTEEAIERNVSEYNISHASNSENTNPTNEAVSAKFKSPRKDTYDSLAYFDTVDTTDKAKREFTEKEIDALRKEKRRHAIEAESIEREDVLDITHLLVALGIPFMYAPMEAEAQCSYMINCGLVDAVISDDSDVLIFGGTSVYRNAFKKGKRIQRYTLSLIKDVLGIDRMKLIEFAYLFGGDYTEGIYGIGAATAREIIGGWNGHGVEKLKKFQEWHRSIIKAGSANASPNNEPNAPLDAKLVRRCKKLRIPSNFCNPEAQNEYLSPQVNTRLAEFSWEKPRLDMVRKILLDKTTSYEEADRLIHALDTLINSN